MGWVDGVSRVLWVGKWCWDRAEEAGVAGGARGVACPPIFFFL